LDARARRRTPFPATISIRIWRYPCEQLYTHSRLVRYDHF